MKRLTKEEVEAWNFKLRHEPTGVEKYLDIGPIRVEILALIEERDAAEALNAKLVDALVELRAWKASGNRKGFNVNAIFEKVDSVLSQAKKVTHE